MTLNKILRKFGPHLTLSCINTKKKDKTEINKVVAKDIAYTVKCDVLKQHSD